MSPDCVYCLENAAADARADPAARNEPLCLRAARSADRRLPRHRTVSLHRLPRHAAAGLVRRAGADGACRRRLLREDLRGHSGDVLRARPGRWRRITGGGGGLPVCTRTCAVCRSRPTSHGLLRKYRRKQISGWQDLVAAADGGPYVYVGGGELAIGLRRELRRRSRGARMPAPQAGHRCQHGRSRARLLA